MLRAKGTLIAVVASGLALVGTARSQEPPPPTLRFSSPCVAPPQRDVQLAVRSREANPPPEREAGSRRTVSLRTERRLDLDGDGQLDVVVPIVERGDCPHEVEYDLYVMRGACGHLVGRTRGVPQVTRPAPPGGLAELHTDLRWSEVTDPSRETSASNVATHHEVRTPYVARGGRYRPGRPTVQSGICHHCAIPHCRVVSGL